MTSDSPAQPSRTPTPISRDALDAAQAYIPTHAWKCLSAEMQADAARPIQRAIDSQTAQQQARIDELEAGLKGFDRLWESRKWDKNMPEIISARALLAPSNSTPTKSP